MAIGFAFYASVFALPGLRRWYLFTARFIIGAAGGTVTLCYSYVASASHVCDAGRRLSNWNYNHMDIITALTASAGNADIANAEL
ncbi:hypothetical protein OUZ56_018449 [Daphnia magna]|uniref:Uncharacterized protein n=1 Tax=Daphnia magna TaxID=35525 RepID=A0ABQ9Z8W2_9CRUS|nr:hypothetical protein OUZ56_018449 [Daphnia magna]